MVGETAAVVTGQNLDMLPHESVILMRTTNGADVSADRDINIQNVAILFDTTQTTATFVWTISGSYGAVPQDRPKGHTWQGLYTPYDPPRELVATFD